MHETIKSLREQNGFSQTYLASYLEVSRQMYIKYENGEVEPPVKIIKALCKLYSVSYDVIIDNKLSNHKITYSSESKGCVVSSPAPVYGTGLNDSFELLSLFSQIRRLPRKSIPSVSAFIMLLQQEEAFAKKTYGHEKSKKAFFDLAGKISLDADSVTSFRQESLI